MGTLLTLRRVPVDYNFQGEINVRVQKRILLLFLFPAISILFLFKVYPIFLAFYRSLFSYSFMERTLQFVGLQNFIDLFSDPVFINSLLVTLKFNVLVNPLQVIGAILLAVLANQVVKGINIFRTLFYLPVAISVPIASIIWGLLLKPNGFVNSILAMIGIPKQMFLNSETQALYVIILIVSWIGFSYWMIFILAALQEIPVQVYESSRIDGASSLQSFFYITLPMIKKSIVFITVGATTSNFLMFAPVYTLTSGGPAEATHLLMYEAYESAFSYSNLGRSNAIVVILLVLILCIAAIQLKMINSE